MKILIALTLTFCAFGLVQAAEKKNKEGKDVFTKYDKNNNGTLDPDEVAAIREDFKKGDEALKAYDTNKDGTLDDNEIAAIKPPEKMKKKK